jgi:hypothetical protein
MAGLGFFRAPKRRTHASTFVDMVIAFEDAGLASINANGYGRGVDARPCGRRLGSRGPTTRRGRRSQLSQPSYWASGQRPSAIWQFFTASLVVMGGASAYK